MLSHPYLQNVPVLHVLDELEPVFLRPIGRCQTAAFKLIAVDRLPGEPYPEPTGAVLRIWRRLPDLLTDPAPCVAGLAGWRTQLLDDPDQLGQPVRSCCAGHGITARRVPVRDR